MLKLMVRFFQNKLVWIGFAGFFTVGMFYIGDVFKALAVTDNIWWTNKDMKVSLSDAGNRIEIYIDNRLLQKQLGTESIYSIDGNVLKPLTAKNISLRFNNGDKVRLALLKQAAVTGFFAGGFFALLLVGLWQEYSRLRSPAELPEPDASPVA
ncbi:MAG: hypothetical protein QM235_12135 [Pseudomonadota bacterium]|jgi:hypothetical protein|nr:hypothetical protein [Pseudomonadota bacterium]